MGWKHADSYTKSKGLLQRRVLLPWLGSSSCCSAHAEAYHLRGGWHVKQPYDTGNYKYLTHELAYAYDIQAYKHVCMYLYIYIHTRLTDFLHIYRPSRDHSQIPRYKWECLKIRSAPSPQIFIENAMFGALLFWSTSTLFFFNDYTIIIPVGITYTHWKWIPPLRATQIALVSEGSGGIRKGGGRITRPHHPPIHFCNSQTFFNNHVISRRGSKQRFGSGTWLRPSPNMFWIGCDLLSRLWRWCCGASTAGWVCFL